MTNLTNPAFIPLASQAKAQQTTTLSQAALINKLASYIRVLGSYIRPGARDHHVFTQQNIRFYLNDEDDLITVTTADNLVLLKAHLKPNAIMFLQPGNWLEKILAYYEEDYNLLMKDHAANGTTTYYQNGGAFNIELPAKP